MTLARRVELAKRVDRVYGAGPDARALILAAEAVTGTIDLAWNESAHPRQQKGGPGGGEFAAKQRQQKAARARDAKAKTKPAKTKPVKTAKPKAGKKQPSLAARAAMLGQKIKPGGSAPTDPKAIRALQTQLGLKPSGKYDGTTRSAVTKFQRRYHLQVDGIAGRQTMGTLRILKSAKTKKPR